MHEVKKKNFEKNESSVRDSKVNHEKEELNTETSKTVKTLPTTVEQNNNDTAEDEILFLIANKKPVPHHLLVDYLMEKYIFRTILDTDEILFYENGAYRFNAEKKIIMKELQLAFKQIINENVIREVCSHIRNETRVERTKFDKYAHVINVKNGLFNLELFKLEPHDSDYLSIIQIPVNYDPNAKCPKNEKTFHEWTDPLNVQVLIEFAGYCLYRKHPIKKLIILCGVNDTGKSKFIEFLRIFLGKNNTWSASLKHLTQGNFSRGFLYGKLLNAPGEISQRYMNDDDFIKRATGGDSIHTDKKFKDEFDFDSFSKYIFCMNLDSMPIIYKDSTFNRILPIEFTNVFSGQNDNPNIIEEITTPDELSGFLNLALKALKDILKQNHFSINLSNDKTKDLYTILTDNSLHKFITLFCNFGINKKVEIESFYNNYLKYCKSNKISRPMKKVTVTKILVKKYGLNHRPVNIKKGKKTTSKRFWIGIKLK